MSEKKQLNEGYKPKEEKGYQPVQPPVLDPKGGYVPETSQQQQQPIPPPKEE